jgi:hypothetical protein
MIRNYVKIAWRNLIHNKVYSAINIGGLAVGMAVAMLIGLWIYDELSVNKYYQNYDRIAQVMRNRTINGETGTRSGLPIPVAGSLRTTYGDNFRHVILAWSTSLHTLTIGNQAFSKSGKFMTPEGPDMLSLKMLKGSRDGLKEPGSILLSESVALALFGEENPLHKTLAIDNTMTVEVTGAVPYVALASAFGMEKRRK